MTYWVQNNATRKILVGIVVLVIILGVSIPLTVFALNDEEDLQLVRVASAPAVASISQGEANGSSDSAMPAAVAQEDNAATVNKADKVEPQGPETDQAEPGSSPEVRPVDGRRDQIDQEVPVAITVAPHTGESGAELDVTIAVTSPFSFSTMSHVRVEAVQEGPVWFLPETFDLVPYTAAGESDVVSFLIWEGLEIAPGETLEISGKVRASGSEEFSILANVQGNSEVLVSGSADKKLK